jgi:hypothetical protein
VERAASVREPQHLLLTRPRYRRIEKAGDTDSARQPTIDGGLDEAWREESQRYRHADVARAAGLPRGGGQRPQMVVVITSSERTPFVPWTTPLGGQSSPTARPRQPPPLSSIEKFYFVRQLDGRASALGPHLF